MRYHNLLNRQSTLYILITISIFMLLASCNYPPFLQHDLTKGNFANVVMSDDSGYYPADVFIPFLTSLENDAALVGVPLSSAYADPATGNTIQYYQKVRLESQKVLLGEDSVMISPLGKWLLDEAVGTEVIIDQDCTSVSDSTFPVCAEFNKFYQTHQGLLLIGKPISNVYQTENRFYQYFENACLIWDPSSTASNQVSLANLGEVYLLSKDPYRDAITQPSVMESLTHNTINDQTLQVFVAFEDSFIARNQEQVVYIQVLDSSGQAVSDAMVGVLVQFPDDTQQQYRPASTDAHGMTSFMMLDFHERNLLKNDIITVNVSASSDSAEGYSAGWFRIWE